MNEKDHDLKDANAADKLQSLWDSSLSPELSSFLPDHPDLSAGELLQIALVDQANRWRIGSAPSVEKYLIQFPVLADDDVFLADLAYGEYRARKNTASPLVPDELYQRFPSISESLKRQIEIADWMNPSVSSLNQAEETIYPTMEDTVDDSMVGSNASSNSECSDPLAPLSLNDFRLEKKLGSGAMGSVHLATQISLQKPVAIKMLGEVLRDDSGATDRFLKEARAVASLKHPYIVDVHGVGRCPDGGYFLVMDLLGGTDLEACIADGPLEIDDAVTIVEKVARAIDHAHSRGVVHRDLKPSNIMLDEDGQPIVTDFGLAKLDGDPSVSKPGEMIGTPKYMAPEQVDPSCGEVGPATDIFGIGGLLYALLIGKGPNSGQTVTHVLANLLSDTPAPRLRESRPEVSTAIETICAKCLKKNPEDRYTSARQIEDALRAYREGRAEQGIRQSGVHAPLTDSQSETPVEQSPPHPTILSTQNLVIPILVAVGAIGASLTSLVMSYYVNTTPAWSLRFDHLENPQLPIGTGFTIDAMRIGIFVSLTVFICWYRLNEHFLTFMNPKVQSWRVNAFRAFFLAIAVFFGTSEARRHLTVSLAPMQMYDWAVENGLNTTPENEAIPYRAFLLYSLVSYTFVLPSLVAIPFYAFSKGLKELRTSGYKLLPTNTANQSGKQVVLAFSNYERQCEKECGRYLDVLGIGALSIHFEYWVGNLTMTDGGRSVMRIGWLAEFTGAAILIWIAWLYSNAVCNTKDSLLNSQSVSPAVLGDQKNGFTFIKTVFLSGPGGLLLLSLLILWVHSLATR